MKYTIYDSNTGEIVSVYSTNDLSQAETNLNGATYIEGGWSGKEYKIINGRPVARTEPIPPLVPYETQTRLQRNGLLADVDRVNPIWYNSLTIEQQTALAEYRQALLDVPAQSGFPASIAWPTKPAWL
jgi:hypothetical protein